MVTDARPSVVMRLKNTLGDSQCLCTSQRKDIIRVTLTCARALLERKENKGIVLVETTKNRRCRKADPRHGHVQVA